jgi:hypothetical protein
MRLLVCIAVILTILSGLPAQAQVPGGPGVQQSGKVTRGHGVQWETNGVIGDSGGPAATGSGINGTFVCPTITVSKGVITAAVNGSCSGPSTLTLGVYAGGSLGLYAGGSLALY